jgi:dinuclear metal center YbgI/SA1388 family protein
MVIAHHGMIWEGLTSVRGAYRRQIGYCLEHGLNLWSCHLPLDMHETLGNNIGLAKILGLRSVKPFGAYHGYTIGFKGTLPRPLANVDIAAKCAKAVGGTAEILPFGKEFNRTVAIVSGGASGELVQVIEEKVDCYLSGEPAHHNHHQALEGGVNAVYLGHYHSEKPGVLAVGRVLEKEFGIKTLFLDLPTIV